ncbi:MAG: 6,7-dimethyl-8-ribityllumazine synthase [Dehalococcoidia bacterium]
MVKSITGSLMLTDQTIAVVVSRFNSLVTQQLLSGAEDVFLRQGGREENLTVVWVPGAFEIPAMVKRLAESGQYLGILALGALVKGATLHFEVLAHQVTQALVDLSLQLPVPVSFGVLTTNTLEQALERAGTKGGNKGAEAMRALIEMMNLVAQLS